MCYGIHVESFTGISIGLLTFSFSVKTDLHSNLNYKSTNTKKLQIVSRYKYLNSELHKVAT